jgi:hypothetical protein
LKTTDSFTQPMNSSETPETAKQEWVSAVLRRVAKTEAGRLRILATLTAADLWRIWHGTAHRGRPHDRRTHEITTLELIRRGLLDSAGQPLLVQDQNAT